ncbi:MAG: hypothetical protein ACT4PY_13715 [Armatimonadota bacterium]
MGANDIDVTRQAAAAATIILVAGLSFAAIVATGGDGRASPGHGSMSGTATAEQRTAAAKLLDDVKKGTVRFADVQVAVADGYRQTTPFRFRGQWGPAHFNNFAYNRDGRHLDPARPEALVYIRLEDARIVLLGAMFVAPKGQGPRPAGPLTEWHVHDNLCLTGTGSVALATGPGQCPPGSFFVGEAVEMMHVWFFDHPDGPFAHDLTAAAIREAVQYARHR